MTTAHRVWRSGWAQALRRRAGARSLRWCSSGGAARTGEDVCDAFRFVIWSWIVARVPPQRRLPRCSARSRGGSRSGRRCRRSTSRGSIHVFSSFGVGLLANAIVPGRLGELARVATLRRHLPDAPPGTSGDARRDGVRAPPLRPRAGDDAGRLGAPDGRGAALGGDRVRGSRPSSASRSSPSPGWALAGTTGRCMTTAAMGTIRHLLGHGASGAVGAERARPARRRDSAPVPRVAASSSWRCGSTMQAFGIDAPFPAAGLVLVLMNVATIVPLWPGNVGLVQAAVALPLRNYGVAVRDGVRVRTRAPGDRDRMRRRPRAARARARRDLVRRAPAHGGRGGVVRERRRGGGGAGRGPRARGTP